MKTKIKTQELLDILKSNRESHRAIFLKAQEGYRKKAISIFEQRLEDMRDGKKINTYIRLTEPVDQTEDYDRAIQMVEMHDGEHIELDQKAFSNFVMDKWDWTQRFTESTSEYLDY